MQTSFIAAPPKDLVLEEGFRFLHGQTIAPFTIRYETFGELNAEKSNAILVCHALSASAHAADKYAEAEVSEILADEGRRQAVKSVFDAL